MNLLMGVTLRADEDYEQLCYLLLQHGNLEEVTNKCDCVVDVVIKGILSKLEITETDENFMKIVESILCKETFDDMVEKFDGDKISERESIKIYEK